MGNMIHRPTDNMIHSHKVGLWDDHSPGDGRLMLSAEFNGTDGLGPLSIVAGPDPRVLLADEVLYALRYQSDLLHPDITLQSPTEGHGSTGHSVDQYDCRGLAGGQCYHGSILRIKTVERDLVYIVDTYEPELNGWWAHWPD